jgi:putative tryptophan/tyrosine transport system substrate-binding protein
MIILAQTRALLALLATATLGPLTANAQPPTPSQPHIGFLNSMSPGPAAALVAAFRAGLEENGYVEGRNVTIEYRWAEGQYDRLAALADDLVRRKVSVIAATGGTVSARAAKEATTTVPIVFLGGANPVGDGLVTSFSRPGGNITGVSTYTSDLAPKRIQLLRDLLPGVKRVVILTNPDNFSGNDLQDIAAAARSAGLQTIDLKAKTLGEFESVFVEAKNQGAEALLVSSDPFFTSRRDKIIQLAALHKLPTGYAWREYVKDGGLISYGTSLLGSYRQVGQYVGQVLRGARPADLPVKNPTEFLLTLNVTTAKTLGVPIPRIVHANVNEFVE